MHDPISILRSRDPNLGEKQNEKLLFPRALNQERRETITTLETTEKQFIQVGSQKTKAKTEKTKKSWLD